MVFKVFADVLIGGRYDILSYCYDIVEGCWSVCCYDVQSGCQGICRWLLQCYGWLRLNND